MRPHSRLVFHAVTNEWFRIDGDEAIGESYVIAVRRLRAQSGERDTLTVGRYFARFERRSNRWKFIERRFVLDHYIAGHDDAPLPDSWAQGDGRGAFAPHDPIYRFWARRWGA